MIKIDIKNVFFFQFCHINCILTRTFRVYHVDYLPSLLNENSEPGPRCSRVQTAWGAAIKGFILSGWGSVRFQAVIFAIKYQSRVKFSNYQILWQSRSLSLPKINLYCLHEKYIRNIFCRSGAKRLQIFSFNYSSFFKEARNIWRSSRYSHFYSELTYSVYLVKWKDRFWHLLIVWITYQSLKLLFWKKRFCILKKTRITMGKIKNWNSIKSVDILFSVFWRAYLTDLKKSNLGKRQQK